MMVLDDLQWCDSTTLNLISEVLISVGSSLSSLRQVELEDVDKKLEVGEGGGRQKQPLQQEQNRLLFVGMYRDNEITASHPSLKQIGTTTNKRDI